MKSKIKNALKVTMGFIFISLAAVGLFLPVWPTTPFVLLALGCFSASPAIRAKILKIKFVEEYYEAYVNGSGVAKKTVAYTFIFLWGMLAISILLVNKMWLRLLLFVIGAAVSVHILCIAKVGNKKQADNKEYIK